MSSPVALTTVKLAAPASAGAGRAVRIARDKEKPTHVLHYTAQARAAQSDFAGRQARSLSGSIENLVSRPRALDNGSRSRAMAEALLQRQRRRAECALGQYSAKIPVGPAAAGAVIDLIITVNRVIAARSRIELSGAGFERVKHSDIP